MRENILYIIQYIKKGLAPLDFIMPVFDGLARLFALGFRLFALSATELFSAYFVTGEFHFFVLLFFFCAFIIAYFVEVVKRFFAEKIIYFSGVAYCSSQ